jgi:rhamnogalacturonan endolyase
MKQRHVPGLSLAIGILFVLAAPTQAQYQVERLSRGVVAVRTGSAQVYVGWRLFGNDPSGTAFNVYRTTGGSTVRLNASPITATTNLVDSSANLAQSNAYFVRAVVGGSEQGASATFTLPANAPTRQYLEVPLQLPPGGTVQGASFTYTANDLSVGDLDGDGEYEYVLKWDPSNAKDNSQSGFTGNVLLDAYRLNGTRLWRIDLGPNIRAGAHYTQFMVYDLDGDGRAEVACKTADGTRSGTGQVIGNASADHRNSSGYVLAGPEFLTVFNGQTGAALATTNYLPARGTVSDWGDNYGNRVDRFLAGVAYLDGQRPSLIMARGYYTRTVVVAWDWRNGALTRRWTFDSNASGSTYTGRGNHQLSVADVDGDGRQEVIYGSLAIDDNGQALWVNGHHGDALHVGDFIPSRAGLEVFKPTENGSDPADLMIDARTGQTIWSHPACSCDNGRGVAADIWAGSPGAEAWSSNPAGVSNNQGQNAGRKPGPVNFLVWWDADRVRELLDSNRIDKYGTSGETRLLTADGATSNNGTKSTPALSGDLLGDWREEVVWRTTDNRFLRIYTTTAAATNRLYTFLHDPQYRVALAWQNVGYNQPPHPSFFVGEGMNAPPTPNIVIVGGPPPTPGGALQAEAAVSGGGAAPESVNGGFTGSGYVNFPATGGFLEFRNVDGGGGGSRTLRIRFALGITSSRTGRLLVNGAGQNITFNPTGAWTTWVTLDVPVNLASGTGNTIRFESNGQDLANLDQVELP